MTMAGSAIGLGNIWRFPYMVGEHGGSMFVIVYLFCTLIFSLPVFISEIVIGRRSGKSSYLAMSSLTGGNKWWKLAGLFTVLIPCVITSYYSVVGGWSLHFLWLSLKGVFTMAEPDSVTGLFSEFVLSGWGPIALLFAFLAICGLVVSFGVKTGIEKFNKITIPILFVMIILIMVYSLSLPGSMEGVRYLVTPDFSSFNSKMLVFALGQSFYSLSLGLGAIITYGSYVSRKEDIVATSFGSAISDLIFALIAGFAIMPAVFAAGIAPGAGPGLIFQSIPFVFAKMGAASPVVAYIVAILFFLSIVVAALSSTISMYEVMVAYLIEHFKMKRIPASIMVFLIVGGLGILSAMPFGILDFLDALSSNVLLVLCALISVIFVGWTLKKEDVEDEITNGGKLKSIFFKPYYYLVKYLAPVFLIVILIYNFIS